MSVLVARTGVEWGLAAESCHVTREMEPATAHSSRRGRVSAVTRPDCVWRATSTKPGGGPATSPRRPADPQMVI